MTPGPGRDRRGLTLIELVLTMTILAIAGALVSGALATALRSWQSGLRGGREELVSRIVLERIAAQLRAAVPAPASRNDEEAVAFDAGPDHLRFVTLAAGAAPKQVFYGVREGGAGRHLLYREHPWPDKEFFGSGKPRHEEDVVEVTGFAVKVFRRTEQMEEGAPESGFGAVAAKEWSPLDRELPARVEIEIRVGDQGGTGPRIYAVSVPVLAQAASQ